MKVEAFQRPSRYEMPAPARWKDEPLLDYREIHQKRDLLGRRRDHVATARFDTPQIPWAQSEDEALYAAARATLVDSSGNPVQTGTFLRFDSYDDAHRGALMIATARESRIPVDNAYNDTALAILRATPDPNGPHFATVPVRLETRKRFVEPWYTPLRLAHTMKGTSSASLTNFHPDLVGLVSRTIERDLRGVPRDATLIIQKAFHARP